MRPVSSLRLRDVNDAPVRPEGRYVLHWITAHRRLAHNFTLDHAVFLANELGKPLLILEALRVGYPYASARLHRFILDGMADDVESASAHGVTLHAYVEPRAGAGSGLLEALARDAAVVVTDDYPCFFLPRMIEAAGRKLAVRLVAVDTNGLLPMRLATPVHASAYAFRRELQKLLPPQLEHVPSASPLEALVHKGPVTLPAEIHARHPSHGAGELRAAPWLSSLPIDHAVPPVTGRRGGTRAAAEVLARFVDERLPRYLERSHPDAEVASGLSPYLHFGHVSAHAVFAAVTEGALDPRRLVPNQGKREGYYGLDPAREAFLDQLVTWRELGFHYCLHVPEADRFESLPAWARATLDEGRADERTHLYDESAFESAATHDPIWNAAQRELRETGTITNYLRMLWGKKILEWTESPEEAWRIMIRLNDRWALDGRDPNSYSGIGWVLGRFDRPWAPKRPVFGAIRFMSSARTVQKLDLAEYLRRFGPSAPAGTLDGASSAFVLTSPPPRPRRRRPAAS